MSTKSYSMELGEDGVLRVTTLRDEFTSHDVDEWQTEYDYLMRDRTVTTHVLINTNSLTSMSPDVRRLMAMRNYTKIYPNLGYTIIYGKSRIIKVGIDFINRATRGEDKRMVYFGSEDEAVKFLEKLQAEAE